MMFSVTCKEQKFSAAEILIQFLSLSTHTPRYLNGILSVILEPPLCGTNPQFDLFLWKKENAPSDKWLSLSWQWEVRLNMSSLARSVLHAVCL
jgi:hypothetical protein